MIKEIAQHRSVRRFKDQEIPQEVMHEMLMAATRASTTGTMQLYSIIVSSSPEQKERLSPCHFNQPMVKQCAAVLTFCADVHRFSEWCFARDAEPSYQNFAWFINGTIDALLASENLSLEAQAHGLGICYLGTTIYNADQIIDILDLPKGVIPVATVVVGYPEEPMPTLTERLPLEAVVHYEKYKHYTPKDIDELYYETENSPKTAALLKENDLPNLARIFTEKRYTKPDNIRISRDYLKALIRQGFMSKDLF